MLIRVVAALAVLGVLVPLARAQGHDAHEALRRPERITVGIADQFLGQLAPDEKTLYFVSSQETRKEIYSQDIDEGRMHMVFDEGADVTWPRVSPDGKTLLYISFSDQATGQLCVRSLPDGGHRRCLERAPAALQAEWIDRKHIALIGRTSIGGDLRISQVTVERKLSARTLFDKNWTHPAISPDGRWLIYIPLDRMAKRVGPGFAARATRRLEVVRLDQKGASVPLTLDLPGLTGQPAFARDGRALYFVQFFSDSNHDGTIDASDHGVLFRVPWASGATDAPARASIAAPVQLTDSGSDCQYPAPSAQRLITTCLVGHELDIYELPLDGEVPADWTADRIRKELALGARREEQLLLYRHALGHAATPSWARLLEMRLVMTHLEVEEFDAAEFYAQKIRALRDPATHGMSEPLLALVAHRRARSEQERGRMVDTFADEALLRAELLRDEPSDSAPARVLNHLVLSEIADSLGDKLKARQELDAAPVDDHMPRAMIEAFLTRADALYRELDDRVALVAAYRRFASSEALTADHRLEYARAAVRALTRGLPFDQTENLLRQERALEQGDSELGFALDLAALAIAIRDASPALALQAQLLALYDAQKTRADRKRAIVLDALQRAAEVGADPVIEAISERYVDDVSAGTEERHRAERLYRRAIMGRAFRRLEAGQLPGARKDFDDVFRRTGSYEAVVGSIDLRLRQGESPETIATELDGADQTSPHTHFVQAYLIACDLERVQGEAHAKAVAKSRELLRRSWGAFKNKPAARALYGSIMHEDFLRTGDLAAAESANSHYLVALGLAQNDPRYRAMLLGQLGLLHTHVENYRIALDYLEQRAKLPFDEDIEAFSVRLALADAYLHVGQDREAAATAEQALALTERVPALRAYHTLALDRAALANLAAHQFERALTFYDVELPLLAGGASGAAQRNRFVVQLARAAAGVGSGQPQRALLDLDALEPALADRALVALLVPAHSSAEHAGRSYASIAAGLRANANLALGQRDLANTALERQRVLFVLRFSASDRDEDARALTLVETRLAENAAARGKPVDAAKWISSALARADALVARANVGVDREQLRVLRVAAELSLLGGIALPFAVGQRLAAAYDKIVKLRDPAWRPWQRWFEIYLALLKARGSGPVSEARSPSFRSRS